MLFKWYNYTIKNRILTILLWDNIHFQSICIRIQIFILVKYTISVLNTFYNEICIHVQNSYEKYIL